MTKFQRTYANQNWAKKCTETIKKFDEENPNRMEELRKLMGKEFDRLMKED